MRFSAPTGLAVAVGPLVGGAIVDGASWQWIFWMNVPIGVAILPFARTKLTESKGTATRLDWPGLVLASLGLFGIVLGVVRGNAHGWTSMTVLPPMVIGAVLVAAFVAWELRGARNPMLPMRLFRSRGFTMTNTASLLMYFGMFGSIFLLAQFLQVVQHYSPLEAGLRTLPWTGMRRRPAARSWPGGWRPASGARRRARRGARAGRSARWPAPASGCRRAPRRLRANAPSPPRQLP